MNGQGRGYRPISDYALIGDCHTAALVATDGSIDWCCLPRFDSPAVFCRLLDAGKGGWFRIGPVGGYTSSRSYMGSTNVLSTLFTSDYGCVRITDFMPLQPSVDNGSGAETPAPRRRILRLVEGLSGSVEIEISFRPTFDFSRAATTIEPSSYGAVARAGKELLSLACPVRLEAGPSGGLVGRRQVTEGERFWAELTYQADGESAPGQSGMDADAQLERTLEFWRRWSAACTYRGAHDELVRRSALTLKLLTFEPTGALVAAPTTSLPVELDGIRNWDYRYAWLRDSALALYALQSIGYHGEAMSFFGWLEDLCTCVRGKHPVMYRIDGSSQLPERILDHLEGYRESRPVRIGNAAVEQAQLDVYGHLLDAAHICHERMGHPVDAGLGVALRSLADQAASRWREPTSSFVRSVVRSE